jgi:hypothetical protein
MAVLYRAAAVFLLSLPLHAACIPHTDASKHVGETRCVTGKVLRVQVGNNGAHFFDFCEDYRTCPFTVVVFASRLRDIGDVRQLEGKQITINGPIKMYDGRAEIVLERFDQLGGEGVRIPPLPKTYDVEKKGKYSAGSFSHAKSRKPAQQPKGQRVQIEEQVDPSDSEQ